MCSFLFLVKTNFFPLVVLMKRRDQITSNKTENLSHYVVRKYRKEIAEGYNKPLEKETKSLNQTWSHRTASITNFLKSHLIPPLC